MAHILKYGVLVPLEKYIYEAEYSVYLRRIHHHRILAEKLKEEIPKMQAQFNNIQEKINRFADENTRLLNVQPLFAEDLKENKNIYFQYVKPQYLAQFPPDYQGVVEEWLNNLEEYFKEQEKSKYGKEQGALLKKCKIISYLTKSDITSIPGNLSSDAWDEADNVLNQLKDIKLQKINQLIPLYKAGQLIFEQ